MHCLYLQASIIQQSKEFLLCLCTEYLHTSLSEVGNALEERTVGQMATYMDDASQLCALALLEGIVLTKRIGHTGAYVTLEHIHLPVERHRLVVPACVEVCTHILEEPRLTKGGTSNHYSVHSIVLKGICSLLCRTNISIAYHRYVHARICFDLTNECPVGVSLIHLTASATMNGQCLYATILQSFSQFEEERLTAFHSPPLGWYRIERRSVPAKTRLHCDWNLDFLHHLTCDVEHELRRAQHTRTCTLSRHLLHRATEVDVKNVGVSLILHNLCRLHHTVHISSIYLNCYRTLLVIHSDFLQRTTNTTDEGISTHKLRIHHAGTKLLAEQPKCLVGHIFHWC